MGKRGSPPDIGGLEGAGWVAAHAAVVGKGHVRSGLPCQDSALSGVWPRPFVVVCDGRGGSPLSQLGSQAAVDAIADLLDGTSAVFDLLLDKPGGGNGALAMAVGLSVAMTAAKCQEGLAATMPGTRPEDFESTLAFACVGQVHTLVVNVGDGAVVGEVEGVAKVLSAPDNGEFANTTTFVRYSDRGAGTRMSLIPSTSLTALAAFTDGAATRLLKCGTNEVAEAIPWIWGGIRDGTMDRHGLIRFLTEDWWEPGTLDDRALAMVAMSGEKNLNPKKEGG